MKPMPITVTSPREDSSTKSLFIKVAILALLCIQNAGHALITRYSRVIKHEVYSSSEVVFMGEVLKVCVSAYLTVKETESEVPEAGYKRLIWLSFNSKKVIVLVLLYTTSNMLTYYALARVEAAVYTVLQQLKIFSTAIFSVLLLGKALTGTQWRALALLVVGCILVASPHISAPAKAASRRFLAYSTTDATSQNTEESLSGVFLGICAVIVMVIMSGFSATYFEGILKTGGERLTIWERNFQLALYSLLLIIGVMMWETVNMTPTESAARDLTPFKGWTITTVFVMLVQAGGGLLVAATLKYADAILKTLAVSGSIVLSALLGCAFLGGMLDLTMGMGCFCTMLAIANYTFVDKPPVKE